MTVFRTLVERFAQEGQIELEADVLIEVAADENFLRGMAAFFWESQQALSSDKKGDVGE